MARFKDRVKGEEMMGEAGRSGEGMESKWSISRRSGTREERKLEAKYKERQGVRGEGGNSEGNTLTSIL